MSFFIDERLVNYVPKERKIFVSYKYGDKSVLLPVPNVQKSVGTVRDYVTWLENKFTNCSDHVYKGEHVDEDLSQYSERYIWDRLKDKLYDSSVTIVLISPGMKEYGKWQRSQWIPWEISYSIRYTERKGRISRRNALLGVILPDKNGNYSYYDSMNLFPIIQDNVDSGYMELVTWKEFRYNCDEYINRAIARSGVYNPKVSL